MSCTTKMKKYPKYQLRVSEEMLSTLVAVGSKVVREWLEKGVGVGFTLGLPTAVVAPPVPVQERVVPAQTSEWTPAWKVKLDQQQAQIEAEEARKSAERVAKFRADLEHDAEFGPGGNADEEIDITDEERAMVSRELEAKQRALAAGYAPMRQRTLEEREEQIRKLRATTGSQAEVR